MFDRNPHTVFKDEEDEISSKKNRRGKMHVDITKITNFLIQIALKLRPQMQGAGSRDYDINKLI